LNDLYRLLDSVFNDGNVHTVLTGFDMLMLKAYYSPELLSRMTRGKVHQALSHILNRINRAGNGRAAKFATLTPKAWAQAVQTPLGPGSKTSQRITAANQALKIANAMDWNDHRLAFGHYASGRIILASDPKAAFQHFVSADRRYAATPGADLHRAYVVTRNASHATTQGNGVRALALIGQHIDRAASSENAVLLFTLLLLRAETRTVRLDSHE
jgi:hypothetical protein